MDTISPDFASLGLTAKLLSAVEREGYTVPTPIQVKAIPHVLTGKDVLGLAQTGTGKTAAFALPMLQRLSEDKTKITIAGKGPRPVRALILTPTRELASQVQESFQTYGGFLNLRSTVVFGGVGIEPQKQRLRAGVDIVVATPGRLLDLISQDAIRLQALEIFVLDEADRMLDMGFIHDVKRIIKHLPPKGRKQTLFFSATMPDEAKGLANDLLVTPVTVQVTPVSSTAERIEQSVYMVDRDTKRELLKHLLKDASMKRVLVFAQMKHACNRIAEFLEKSGIVSTAIHGNKSQNARERALEGFRTGAIRVLVATDIAARGIDIDGITHVINYELPDVPETYVHRIGRTARAGTSGIAVSFCSKGEKELLRQIERLTKLSVPVVADHPFVPVPGSPEKSEASDEGSGRNRRQQPQAQSQNRAQGRNQRRGRR